MQRISKPNNFIFVGRKCKYPRVHNISTDRLPRIVFLPLSTREKPFSLLKARLSRSPSAHQVYTNALLGSLNARDWFRTTQLTVTASFPTLETDVSDANGPGDVPVIVLSQLSREARTFPHLSIGAFDPWFPLAGRRNWIR